MNTEKILLVGGTKQLEDTLRLSLPEDHLLIKKSHVPAHAEAGYAAVLVYQDRFGDTGQELIPVIRQRDARLPIIVIGPSSVPQTDLAEAFRLGANDFIFLPIDPETLLNCLYRFTDRPKPPSKKRHWWQLVRTWFNTRYPLPTVSTVNYISSLPLKSSSPAFISTASDLQVQMLGAFRIIAKGREITNLPGKKATSLLAYLLYKYPKAVHRDALIDKFWPDSTSDSARNCLHVTLHAIRKSFEDVNLNDNIIRYQNECYGISDNLLVARDIELFESYWKKARRLDVEDGVDAAINAYHQAFAFYRGDFMEQYLYDEWAEIGRERFRETWLVILDRLTSHFFSEKKYQICLNLCRRVLYKDPCLEEVHRRLMACYMEMGMKDLAIRQFHKCQEALDVELSISPRQSHDGVV